MRRPRRPAAAALVALLAIASCGGDDDEESSDSTTTTVAEDDETPATVAESTTTTTTTTTAPEETATSIELVTEGATVVVANASIVGGSAGRMTDQLATVGFTTAEPTNATEKVLDSVVHHTDDDGAQEVAESVAEALGGVAVEPLPEEAPVEGGDLGDATVLLLLGDNQADRTLDELQGGGGGDGEAASVETSGLTVVVANASGVDGSAGSMTGELERAGVTVGEPVNAVVRLDDTVVHHSDADGAEDDANAVAEALGGVEVEPLPDEIPTESSELDGDVLVLLGTNQAGESLDSLNP